MTFSHFQRSIPAVLALASLLALAPAAGAQEPSAPATEDSKTLYALGLVLARNLGPFELTDSEFEWVVRGLSDGVRGTEPQVDLAAYGPKIQGMAEARLQAQAAREKTASDAFLTEKAAEAGADERESGLILSEINPGTGESPTATDTVQVHYHGTLRDGSVFDSSVDRGEPVSISLASVIPCWTEGLRSMKVGGKSRLVCPSDIAYGDQGRPPAIPPGAVLIFEVELLGIVAEEEGAG